MYGKVGRGFPMVISSEFRMGQYRDDDHHEDAPYFKRVTVIEWNDWMKIVWTWNTDKVF